MRVDALVLRSGAHVPLGKFNVLVGANNVGKSQSLRDILSLIIEPSSRTTIIERLSLQKPETFDAVLEGLEVLRDPGNIGNHLVRGIHSNLQGGEQLSLNLDSLRTQYDAAVGGQFLQGGLARLRVSYLDAASRLLVARQSASYNPHAGPPNTLLQGLFSNNDAESRLRVIFRDTFNMDVRLDYSGMTELALRVAREFPEIPPDPREAFPIIGKFGRIDDQGDGYRSFAGVMTSLLLSRGRVVLLDEPEAFLHPAQARKLGSWIARLLEASDTQAIVATHNANFLQGILATTSHVDVFRLNRNEALTSFHRLPADAIGNLSRSPLLSSQRVLEAVFHQGVAVCEADADRAFYQGVAARNLQNQNVLFVHAHNKQTVKDVVRLLRDARIPVVAIVDIDILNSTTDFRDLAEALAPQHDVNDFVAERDIVASSVDSASEETLLNEVLGGVRELVGQLERGEHTFAGARSALARVRDSVSRWTTVKANGTDALGPEVQGLATDLIAELRGIGLFVVPVGELEGWLKLGTRQKKRWIVEALEVTARGEASAASIEFVGDVLAALGEARATPTR